ncbi:MAG TPA: hypothetical protein VLZ06_00305 [Solirubrobacteraceae bacterium]|nr:hypothetical protein [Solirubrobacteraceae bacterium]
MPRVIVITEQRTPGHREAVLLDEQVHSIHLDTDHSAGQFIQRLGWAISDAEDVERSRTAGGAPESVPALARAA